MLMFLAALAFSMVTGKVCVCVCVKNEQNETKCNSPTPSFMFRSSSVEHQSTPFEASQCAPPCS